MMRTLHSLMSTKCRVDVSGSYTGPVLVFNNDGTVVAFNNLLPVYNQF